MTDVCYERPVTAKLVVELANGERWDATAEDYSRFRLLDTLDAQHAVSVAMKLVGLDPDDAHAALRHMIQMHVAGQVDCIMDSLLDDARRSVATRSSGSARATHEGDGQ